MATLSAPIQLNRRKFLGCSAVAGLTLTQGVSGLEAASAVESASARSVKLGLIGAGNRGTILLRTLLELPCASIVAVSDSEPKHLARAQGIAEKSRGLRPAGYDDYCKLLERTDIDAVVVALPCDLHADVYTAVLESGKALYAEKPLAPTLPECDRIIQASSYAPNLAVRVGFQRRSHPRFKDAADLVRRGELGTLIEGRANWSSSNGPVNGHQDWLAQRQRSGDWMVEQAVHVWDVYRWLAGSLPFRAFGAGRRDLFQKQQPNRDVTDHYSAVLEWADGFHLAFSHSWIDPADDAFTGVSLKLVASAGGLDLASGALRFRDRTKSRSPLHPGNLPDTRFALEEFLRAVHQPEPNQNPPVSLDEARDATLVGLLVRKAVDERRVVSLEEIVKA